MFIVHMTAFLFAYLLKVSVFLQVIIIFHYFRKSPLTSFLALGKVVKGI